MIKLIKIMFLFCVVSIDLLGVSLRDTVVQTINTNHTIISELLNQDAYKKYVDEEYGDYLPTLDLEAYIENARTNNQPDGTTPAEGWSEKDGWNTQLKLQHTLYDGGLTPSEVNEYVHKYLGNKYRSVSKIERVVKDSVYTYLDLVKQQELMALSRKNIEIHEEYLKIAKEKEDISGEVLESYQVASKHHAILDRYLEYEDNLKRNKSKYKKYVGRELSGNICRPKIHEKLIPSSLKEAIELGLRKSPKMLEQVEKIKEQREVLFQTDSNFKPTVYFELTGTWDDDLELEENGRQDIYSAKIFMSWNLFNGGKDHEASQREYIFLKEERKKLDALAEDVIDEVKKSYNSYFMLKKRIENINRFVIENSNILSVYKKQLDDGTRTFLDILNAESELYRSQIDKLDLEFQLYNIYFDFLESISMLSDSILSDENNICQEYKFVNEFSDKNLNSGENLLNELGLDESLINASEDESEESLNELFIDEIQTNNVEEEKNNRLESIYSNN